LHKPPMAGQKHQRMPLVLALHGCTQNAKTIADESGWSKLADTYGFYVIYPQQRALNNISSCFNWFENSNILKDKGEVLSMVQMIDYATDSLSIDTSRIFVYGLSAGAIMSVALMADYPDLFNMGAVLAGGPFTPWLNAFNALPAMEKPEDMSSKEFASYVREQNPNYKGKYPRMLIMHGTKDNVVNEQNSYHLIKQWAPLLHTDTVPTKTVSSFASKPEIVRKAYCDSTGTEQIIFYEVTNLGHNLMVDPGDSPKQGGQTGAFSINAGFFSTYWIAVDFGLIKE